MSKGPRRKRFRFDCNHLGRGKHCHRCEQASNLEQAGQPLKGGWSLPVRAPDGLYSTDQVKQEITRLRAVSKKAEAVVPTPPHGYATNEALGM